MKKIFTIFLLLFCLVGCNFNMNNTSSSNETSEVSNDQMPKLGNYIAYDIEDADIYLTGYNYICILKDCVLYFERYYNVEDAYVEPEIYENYTLAEYGNDGIKKEIKEKYNRSCLVLKYNYLGDGYFYFNSNLFRKVDNLLLNMNSQHESYVYYEFPSD